MAILTKALKVVFVLLIITGSIFGTVYIVTKEERESPKYVIRTERDLYKTAAYTIDSNQCINFIAVEIVILGNNKTRNVQICGGRYIIEEKWKR